MEPAVYYRPGDHLGVLRRLLIDAIDTTLALVVSVLLTFAAVQVVPEGFQGLAGLIVWAAVWIGYFVVLKGSRFRTLGYIIAGARIVNLQGARPGRLALLGRLSFAVLGPVNFLADLLWISSDPSKQALRDKVAHTLVVRKDAVPAGTGKIVYRTYTLFGWTMISAEVLPDAIAAPTL
jgi:uncharacterized RDD family membrane protein YckC